MIAGRNKVTPAADELHSGGSSHPTAWSHARMLGIQTWQSTFLAEHQATDPGEIDEGARRKELMQISRPKDEKKRFDQDSECDRSTKSHASLSDGPEPGYGRGQGVGSLSSRSVWLVPSITPGVVAASFASFASFALASLIETAGNDSTRGTQQGS